MDIKIISQDVILCYFITPHAVLSRYRVWYRNTSGWSSGSSFVRRAEAASQANGVTIDDDTTEADALRSEPSRVENLNDSPAPRRHRGTSEGDKIQVSQ